MPAMKNRNGEVVPILETFQSGAATANELANIAIYEDAGSGFGDR